MYFLPMHENFRTNISTTKVSKGNVISHRSFKFSSLDFMVTVVRGCPVLKLSIQLCLTAKFLNLICFVIFAFRVTFGKFTVT